ncbi:AAA family ATPase [Cohnella silvisoli]|uniref:AAA family ATPase n=1 Tax=Cohnella silvisoli TaxID=2873699 RepID=A0ABV1KS94_9BACL|nr:AAA family ATPase [Cohnella silvisoli]MCD9021985.1 AAA family ATPase [Cohnella silvisoli]
MNDNKEMTLRTFMKQNIIDLRGFFSIALELVELIRKRHLSGVIVHDLNPANICIQSQSARPTLRLIHPFGSEQIHGQTIVQPDDLIHAFAYISPEQTGRMKRKIDQRSDLYALGVLFYELLTGDVPFKAKSANEWIHAHMALLPIPPRTVKPEVPQMLNDLVMKLLSKTADNRYQSAYGLHDDLRKCSEQLTEKGIIEPFPLGEVDEISRFRLPEKLYGREKELQELLNAYERSCSGSMEIMLIGGHAGSGKTALVKAIQTPVIHKKGYFISGKFDQLNHSIPYASLIIAFRDLIRQILAGSEDQIAVWKTRILEALGQSGIVLIEVISELTLIIGKQPPVEDLPPTESTNRFQTLFSNLIKVFADRKHPLVIWLDNLQWADSASLRLLRVLMDDPSNKYLFIMGTYRNNEIDEGHLLGEMFLDNSSKMDNAIHYLNIKALGYLKVIQYVADALHADQSGIKPLAEALYQKTAGNPFYLKQMLQVFYDEKLLYFNSDKTRWDWDIQSIKEREGFKDVISLIAGRFNTLPEETRQVLRLASCIGNSFDIETLSMLYGQGTDHTEQDLLPALSEGLLLTEKDAYIFLHDHVQRAAYDLMPDEEKKQVHLKIGRTMLRYYRSDTTDDHLFEVVHHLNLGSECMTYPAEIEQLSRLNLQAGRKAKAFAAYVRALELLEKGALLIAAEGWSRHFALYSNLLLESSECRYFCGYFDRAEADLEQLLLRAGNVSDRAKIYVIQITMYAFRKRDGKASDIALKAMAEFGMNIPPKASRLSIMAEIAYTQMELSRKASRLKDLPISRDPLHKALADIVMASSSILFIVNEELAVILFAKYVRMSLKQGHSEAFSIALGSYAMTLAHGLKSYKTALRLAEIALRYSEKADSILLKGKIHCIMALALQFRRPQEPGRYFQKAERLSLEGGDRVYAGYAISSRLITEREDLRRLNHICRQYEEKATQTLDDITLRVLYQTKQYVRLLQSATDTNHLIFSSERFDEGQLLREEKSNNVYKGNLYYYYTCKLEVYYLYGRSSEAVAFAEQSKKLYASLMLSVTQRHCFYHALAITAVYPSAPNDERRNYRKELNQLLAQMKKWKKLVPESSLSKYRIMSAEWARLEGKHSKAAKLYDQAIEWAQETGYPQDEAVANELAAKMFLSLNNNQMAENYLRNACKAYFRWGANGKVRSLQERYPILRTLSFEELDESENSDGSAEKEIAAMDSRLHNGLDNELDMDTLRQASQIGSKGTDETELLEVFLHLAIHHVGAEKGFVLLGKEGKWVVEAEKDINRNRERTVDIEDSYSTAVVQFVMRTRESVVLGEARQSIFAADPHIQRKRPKSILCLPIRYPDNRNGVLYLENNLTSDAFTADRLEVLEMVFSRMAYMKLWQLRDNADEDAKTVEAKITPSLVESLTNREIEILRLMAEGLSNKEIALRLEITEGTVKIHSSNIYGKLQVNRRVQAISKARELQLLD